MKKRLLDIVLRLVKEREFVHIGTCDFRGRPNAAPKFVLKVEGGHIYFIDYTIGRTWKNVIVNPRASISLVDTKNLTGYQLNGSISIISSGKLYDNMYKEMIKKQVSLTAQHIIEEVRGEKEYDSFEVVIPEKFVVLELKIKEAVEINPRGCLKRAKVKFKME